MNLGPNVGAAAHVATASPACLTLPDAQVVLAQHADLLPCSLKELIQFLRENRGMRIPDLGLKHENDVGGAVRKFFKRYRLERDAWTSPYALFKTNFTNEKNNNNALGYCEAILYSSDGVYPSHATYPQFVHSFDSLITYVQDTARQNCAQNRVEPVTLYLYLRCPLHAASDKRPFALAQNLLPTFNALCKTHSQEAKKNAMLGNLHAVDDEDVEMEQIDCEDNPGAISNDTRTSQSDTGSIQFGGVPMEVADNDVFHVDESTAKAVDDVIEQIEIAPNTNQFETDIADAVDNMSSMTMTPRHPPLIQIQRHGGSRHSYLLDASVAQTYIIGASEEQPGSYFFQPCLQACATPKARSPQMGGNLICQEHRTPLWKGVLVEGIAEKPYKGQVHSVRHSELLAEKTTVFFNMMHSENVVDTENKKLKIGHYQAKITLDKEANTWHIEGVKILKPCYCHVSAACHDEAQVSPPGKVDLGAIRYIRISDDVGFDVSTCTYHSFADGTISNMAAKATKARPTLPDTRDAWHRLLDPSSYAVSSFSVQLHVPQPAGQRLAAIKSAIMRKVHTLVTKYSSDETSHAASHTHEHGRRTWHATGDESFAEHVNVHTVKNYFSGKVYTCYTLKNVMGRQGIHNFVDFIRDPHQDVQKGSWTCVTLAVCPRADALLEPPTSPESESRKRRHTVTSTCNL